MSGNNGKNMLDSEERRRIVAKCMDAGSLKMSLRRRMINVCKKMNLQGINQGRSGNLGVRLDSDHFLITPSGIDYGEMEPEDIVCMRMDGSVEGEGRPSSEWRMHRDIFAAKKTVAVLHAHPVHAGALACHGRDIPPFHYMVAMAGGKDIRCAPYALFGTAELAQGALKALEGRLACLLAHHGIITLGKSPEEALELAVELESLSRMYLSALIVGPVPCLGDEEMDRVLKAFSSYGKPSLKP